MNDQPELNIYQKIVGIRAYLKNCQQLSWDINSIDKRYPLDKIPEDQLIDLLDMYEDLRDRLIQMALGANDNEPL